MFKSRYFLSSLAIVGAFVASSANADTVTTIFSPVPAGTSWGTLPGENTGTVAITGTSARSGNGSLELSGDRTRVQTGIQYAPYTTSMGAASAVTGLTFDWEVAADSSNLTYTPALRLLLQDGNTRSELIWEGAYQSSALGSNGTAATNPAGQWYSTSTSDLFYQYVAGAGPTFISGTQTYVMMTLADWIATYSRGATVSGISVGAGSGAGSGYHAFVDNVTYTTTAGSTTYNFEVAAAGVPEPATWAMLMIGFGAMGASLRTRRRHNATSFA